MVDRRIVEDQGIDFPRTLASQTDNNITAICDVIRRPGRLVSERMPDRENQIFVPVEKNLELTVFMFKTMEHCLKPSDIYLVHSIIGS